MLSLFDRSIELDAPTASAIAVAMRVVAQADGTHPAEEQLIQAFEADVVQPGVAPLTDLSAITDIAVQEVFLKSLVLVAFADGRVSDEEGDVIRRYADELGLSELEVARCISEVGAVMLSQLAGVSVFRQQAIDLGQRMGLDAFSIHKALDS